MNEFSVISHSRDETAQIAAAVAPLLHAGDSIMLKGGLACGKTTFVQALVAALESKADVTSPTFTIANFYPVKNGTCLHIDAYRLSSVAEYRDLGLNEYEQESITVVEWGDIIEEDFSNSLSILFEFMEQGETSRKLTFSSSAARWLAQLSGLQSRLGEYLEV